MAAALLRQQLYLGLRRRLPLHFKGNRGGLHASRRRRRQPSF